MHTDGKSKKQKEMLEIKNTNRDEGWTQIGHSQGKNQWVWTAKERINELL